MIGHLHSRPANERHKRSQDDAAPYGCFSYHYESEARTIRFHFGNRDVSGPGPLSREREPVQRQELAAVFADVRRQLPEAEAFVTGPCCTTSRRIGGSFRRHTWKPPSPSSPNCNSCQFGANSSADTGICVPGRRASSSIGWEPCGRLRHWSRAFRSRSWRRAVPSITSMRSMGLLDDHHEHGEAVTLLPELHSPAIRARSTPSFCRIAQIVSNLDQFVLRRGLYRMAQDRQMPGSDDKENPFVWVVGDALQVAEDA